MDLKINFKPKIVSFASGTVLQD